MQRTTLMEYLFKDLGFLFASGSKSKARPARKPAVPAGANPAAPGRSEFSVEGELLPAQRLLFSVDGEEFIITPDTWVVGTLEPGAKVKVKGMIEVGHEKYATSVVVSPPENRPAPKPRK